MDKKLITELKLDATRCRQNVLRMIQAGHHGHVGGALSAIDIVTALYFYKMNIDPKDPKKADRDRFILSAGHKCLCQYANLAEKGYFEKEVLDTYGSLLSHIPGHPDMHKLPGVEANTGALGHGMAIGVGMAFGQRLSNNGAKTYVVLGDGEMAEGSTWEAAAVAAQYGLDNLVAFIDNNGLQISGPVKEIMNMGPFAERFKAFGWAVIDIDGNNMEEIVDVLDRLPLEPGKPTMVVAHTVKAKGLTIGENNVAFHFWNPKEGEVETALAELEEVAAGYEKELRGE